MTQHFVIEKNIPIPERRAAKFIYPFAEMEIGDSFLVPILKEDMKMKRSRITSSINNGRKRTGYKFTSRYLEAEGGIRVWRFA